MKPSPTGALRPVTRHNRQQKMAALARQMDVAMRDLVYYDSLVQLPTIKRKATLARRRVERAADAIAQLVQRPVER